MKKSLYHTVSASTSVELDKAVNGLLDKGYQLYGSPYLSDQQIEGMTGSTVFYQAMTLEQETIDTNVDAIKKEAAQLEEIKLLKMAEAAQTKKPIPK
jgi:hypothetical protein